MKYIQIFEGNQLLKEIKEFKKDFKASELLPLIPQDWQIFASLDDSFAVIWKPESIDNAEAIQFIEILIAKNFEWEDSVSMILFQKASEGGTILDKLGEVKGFNISKEEFIDFLKTFDHKDALNILSTNPSRGNFYLAINIKQEDWESRFSILSETVSYIENNNLKPSTEVQEA